MTAIHLHHTIQLLGHKSLTPTTEVSSKKTIWIKEFGQSLTEMWTEVVRQLPKVQQDLSKNHDHGH